MVMINKEERAKEAHNRDKTKSVVDPHESVI